MKKILLALFTLCGLFAQTVKSQTFSPAHDTVYVTTSSYTTVYDYITNFTGSPITLNWHISGTNFPSDWMTVSALGICDNHLCYNNSGNSMWNPSTGAYGVFTSSPYAAHDTLGAFSFPIDLSGVSTLGSHWLTVTLTDGTTTKTITLIVNRPTTAVQNFTQIENNITLYPNPANNEINVVYGANADVKNISVYNVIGKVMTVYRVNGESANLNLENIPSGIYFLRMFNSHGELVSTRKFTKQQ